MYNANQMVDRLMLCGITKSESVQIIGLIDKWSQTNGLEWTVSHLKLIKQTIIGLYGNDANCVSPYVKTRNGNLTGPFRSIQRLFTLGQKKALAAMMIYSSYVSSRLTADQKIKFEKACTSPAYIGTWSPTMATYDLIDVSSYHNKTVDALKDVEFYIDMRPYGSGKVGHKRAPDHLGKSFDESDVKRSAYSFTKTRLYYELYHCLNCFMPGDWDFLSSKIFGFNLRPPSHDFFPIGKVSVLQEPGFKARFIANPNRVVQHLLQPLGDFLFRCLRALPSDYTFRQDQAANNIKKLLVQGKTSYCFDLSNATDYFPLEIQEGVLLNIANSKGKVCFEYITCFMRLFRAASRCEWYFEDSTICWSRGQPLGLYPSFALFALTHNFLLKELSLTYPGEFFVLGDDVVVFGDELAKAYQDLMSEIGVKINRSKSITSDSVAEFAGRVITRSDILCPYKWRQLSLASVRDFLMMWGIEGIPLLPRHIQEWAMLLASLPEPVGLGYNPLGISIEVRVMGLIHLYFDDDLPSLSEDSVSLADVLKAMPEGSKLCYNTDTVLTRPVRLPVRKLLDFLTPEDLRCWLNDLIQNGLCSYDRAQEITSDFGYTFNHEVDPFDTGPEELKRTSRLVETSKISLIWAQFKLKTDTEFFD